MRPRFETVGVVGGGAWGSALALTAARAGRNVRLWARDQETVAAVNAGAGNPRYLPGIRFDAPVRATGDLAAAAAADLVVLAVPAQVLGTVAEAAAPALGLRPGDRPAVLVVAAKGLERASARRMTEVAGAAVPKAHLAVLSGPGFANDVARSLPTAVTIAAAEAGLAEALCSALGSAAFRPYAETDVVGVEIGGAVKNVLAIAAGIVAGRELGASASAALVARGFAELRRLAARLGARPETLMGLSGLGDLVLTCGSGQSRNFAYGLGLGRGFDPEGPHPLAEGVATAAVARDLARAHQVETPIIDAVAAIIAGETTVEAAVAGLMARPLRREAD